MDASFGSSEDSQGNSGALALMKACQMGHEDIVDLLLSLGCDMNFQNGDEDNPGFTPLMYACEKGHISIASKLIKAGCNVNAQNQYGTTALMKADSVHTTSLLIQSKADVNLVDRVGENALWRAKSNSAIEALLQAGADTNVKHSCGNTLLIKSCIIGDKELASLLIEKNCDLDAKYLDKHDSRITALSFALHRNHADIAKMLIDAKCDIECGIGGKSPLLLACRNGCSDLVKSLIQAQCNVDEEVLGKTLLIHAVEERKARIAKVLIQEGCDVDAISKGGYTALMVACQKGDPRSVKVLLNAGCDWTIRNPYGDSAMEIANETYHKLGKFKYHRDMVQMLSNIDKEQEVYLRMFLTGVCKLHPQECVGWLSNDPKYTAESDKYREYLGMQMHHLKTSKIINMH